VEPFDEKGNRYSQNGEDRIIGALLSEIGKDFPLTNGVLPQPRSTFHFQNDPLVDDR